MKRAAGLAALALASPLAACGSDAPPMSRAAYVAAGTKACDEAAARLRVLSADFARDPAGTSPKIGRSSTTLLDELLALRAPRELADADERLKSALRNAQDVGQSLARAGARRDGQDIVSLQERAVAAGKRLRGTFTAVGLPAGCGDA